MSRRRVLLRADGDERIGLGHIYRLLALGDILRTQADCSFAVRQPSAAVSRLIWANGFSLLELPDATDAMQEATELAAQLPADGVIILDGYHFDAAYQSCFRNSDRRVVCIDDIPERHFTANLVINHNGAFTPANYSAEAHTTFALGPEFALLRRTFRRASLSDPATRTTGTAFVCLGGADPNNDTLKALERCAAVPNITRVDLVLGAAYPHADALLEWLANTQFQVELHLNLSASEMYALMASCPVALCSASTTAFEYASVGGALHLIQTADNQSAIYEHFINQGLAAPAASLGSLTEYQQRTMHQEQQTVFDGRSAERLRKVILS